MEERGARLTEFKHLGELKTRDKVRLTFQYSVGKTCQAEDSTGETVPPHWRGSVKVIVLRRVALRRGGKLCMKTLRAKTLQA